MSDESKPEALAPASQDQRGDTRFPCQGNVEFWIQGSDVRTFARVLDLSFGGCYVEMTATSAPGTKLNLLIEIAGQRFKAEGLVRTSYPCLGMGIEFTEASLNDRAMLSQILLLLSGKAHEAPKHEDGHIGAIILPRSIDSRVVLDRISKFLQNKPSLTRDEFLRLVAAGVPSK